MTLKVSLVVHYHGNFTIDLFSTLSLWNLFISDALVIHSSIEKLVVMYWIRFILSTRSS